MQREGRDAASVWDMFHAVQGVVKAMEGVTPEHYAGEENLRLSIERRLEILGEAARRVSPEFRNEHPEVPWRNVIGQRNILIHEYDDIDLMWTWRFSIDDAPKLLKTLKKIVDELKATGEIPED